MKNKLLGILFIILGFLNQLNAQNYNFQYLTIQKGLPQSQVYAICFDSNNYAWIGTQGGGVAIFNGEEYQYITKQDSLISNKIYQIVEIDNQIWIATKGGISIFNLSGVFIKNYNFKNPSIIARDIVHFKSQIWIASSKGIYNIKSNKITPYTLNPNIQNISIESFLLENDNQLWVNTINGIFSVLNIHNKLNKNKGLITNNITKSISFSNQWLIGTYGNGVQLYDKSKGIITPKALTFLKNDIILDLLVNQNEIWIATMNNGVYVWKKDDNSLKNFSVKNGLSNNHIKSLKQDKWGNIWIGTSGGGISIYNNSPFLEYNTTNGLNSNYIYAVVNDYNNNLWVSTESTGVMRLNDTSTVLFDEDFGYKSVKTRVLFEDHNHNIWFGSEGEGIGVWYSDFGYDTIFTFKNTNGLQNNWIRSITQHPITKQIFIASAEGIYKVKQNKNHPEKNHFIRLKHSLIPAKISQLNFDYKGNLFYASNKGIGAISFKKNQVETVNRFEINQIFRNILIINNFAYAGSPDKGIFLINPNDTTQKKWINNSNWLNSNNIYQLTKKQNELWVGTEKGLVKLKLNKDNSIESNDFYQYEDGFEGVETNTNASFLDAQQNLWFGTTNGLFLFNAEAKQNGIKQSPAFRLKDVQLFYESIQKTAYSRFFNHQHSDSILTLEHDNNHIGFTFEAIQYAHTKQIRYRWKLIGFDKDWTPPTKNTSATYGNLKAGNYTFLAQASIDNDWAVIPISFDFKIKTPFWDTLWFKILSVLLMISFISLIVFLIYNRFKRKNFELREKLELEKSVLELEQKALRLQMNPHFMFNALNSIHNLIILNDPAKARYALSKFSKLLRQVLENSREKYISIDDEIDTLQNYIQLEKLTSKNDFEFKISIDDELDTNEKILPPLMIQPFIENAIIHGFKNIMHDGIIHISFEILNNNILKITIDDNGIGRINASQINAQKENYHKSTALQITQERLANINSNNKQFSPFQIIDKVDDNGYAIGTTIIIQLEV